MLKQLIRERKSLVNEIFSILNMFLIHIVQLLW